MSEPVGMDKMEKVISLCKRRGFVFPGSEIYGGLANSWDFGPYGVQLKKNLKDHWWKFFVEDREDMVGLDAAIIMNPKVWEVSGHIGNFNDPLVECKKCHQRFREDQIPFGSMDESSDTFFDCPNGGKHEFTKAQQFNLMLRTFLGPSEESSDTVYLRPETAQSMFVDFPMIQETSRKKLPFGVAQIGKAFRNEITPGNFIFRTREFEQMEIEYFFDPEKDDWNGKFEYWKGEMEKWMEEVGIAKESVEAVEIGEGDRAHYSKRTIDFEFKYPFGQKELFGLAYRGDYDMERHQVKYRDPEGKEIFPHVIEPSLGVERGLLAILLSAYTEEHFGEAEERTVLKFPKKMAPVQVAVFPLLKNKPELIEKARSVFEMLKNKYRVEFDDNGNVGKRYRRQDEIGTPYCLTIDFDTLDDDTVTIRDRDSMEQQRIGIAALGEFLDTELK